MKDTVGEADTLAPPATEAAASLRYGRYRLGPVLGRGGMGEVLSATDERIGREVAIKRMRGSDPEAITRFIREATVQARLEHPAIVPVHDIAQDAEGKPIIVMKQLRGTTLAEVLRRRDEPAIAARFTPQRLLRAFAEVCMAIELAHSRGVIHRDLKPANITMGELDEVYVLDWGIAKVHGESDQAAHQAADGEIGATVAGTILGTPGYMAPEQARGEPVDLRADVYALGCVLKEILAGQPIPELEAVCARATQPAPAERFPSVRELGRAVEAYVDGDRDVAERQKLARSLVDEARRALAGDSERRAAMQAASRALALDPSSAEAAQLVAQLMLQPPTAVPAEVEREVSRQEIKSLHDGAKIASKTMLSNFAFIPLMYWAGISPPMLAALVILSLVAAISRLHLVRDNAIRRDMALTFLAASIGIHGLIAFAASPMIAAATALVSAGRTSMRRGLISPWALSAWMTLAVLLPVLLGFLGVTPPPIEVVDGALHVHMMTEHLRPVPTAIWLLLLVPGVFASTVAMNAPALDSEREARRATLLQAWWLRQLVP